MPVIRRRPSPGSTCLSFTLSREWALSGEMEDSGALAIGEEAEGHQQAEESTRCENSVRLCGGVALAEGGGALLRSNAEAVEAGSDHLGFLSDDDDLFEGIGVADLETQDSGLVLVSDSDASPVVGTQEDSLEDGVYFDTRGRARKKPSKSTAVLSALRQREHMLKVLGPPKRGRPSGQRKALREVLLNAQPSPVAELPGEETGDRASDHQDSSLTTDDTTASRTRRSSVRQGALVKREKMRPC
jgi:hypothetical protein